MNATNNTNLPNGTSRGMGASGLNILLGIWVIISPFVLGFTRLQMATWSNVATGAAIALLALARFSTSGRAGWSWLNGLLGVWLIVSPFVFGIASLSVPLWNNIILGIIVAIIAWSSGTVHRQSAV